MRHLADGVGDALAADAALLDAAERDIAGAEGARAVDDYPADLQPVGDAQSGVDALREDAGLQAVDGVDRRWPPGGF